MAAAETVSLERRPVPTALQPSSASSPLLSRLPARQTTMEVVQAGKKGRKAGHRSNSGRARLPPIAEEPAEADPFAGVGSLRSGKGAALPAASAVRLMAALKLLGGDEEPAADTPLPTGAGWSLHSIVTADGLQTHAVAPGAVLAPGDVRGGLLGDQGARGKAAAGRLQSACRRSQHTQAGPPPTSYLLSPTLQTRGAWPRASGGRARSEGTAGRRTAGSTQQSDMTHQRSGEQQLQQSGSRQGCEQGCTRGCRGRCKSTEAAQRAPVSAAAACPRRRRPPSTRAHIHSCLRRCS